MGGRTGAPHPTPEVDDDERCRPHLDDQRSSVVDGEDPSAYRCGKRARNCAEVS